MLKDLLIGLFKLSIVAVTIVVVGVGLYLAYQYAFPPSSTASRLELPNLNLTQCSSGAAGFDPAQFAYAYELQQHQDQVSQPASSDNRETTFTVKEGELPSDVSLNLQHEGFILDSDLFLTLVKCRHASEKIQAGDHVLRRNMTMDEIVLSLERGTQRGISVTITPGWRAEQVAEYLSSLNLPQYDKNEFLRLVNNGKFDYAFLQDRPQDASQSLEGYLYPETYNVLQGITSEQMLTRLLNEFDQRITPEMRQKAATEKLTLHEVMTLASIVEREAVLKTEAPIIASVYINRIKKKTFLNADPTVQYAIGYQAATKQWWPVVSIDQYSKVNSPYNTYTNVGLPPGPICEPGLNSIQAALEPATTDYFYFLATGDGSHVFAHTLEEQNANLSKYGYQAVPTPKKP